LERHAVTPDSTLILTLSCTDRSGIVAAVSGLLAEIDANIEEATQYGDRASGRFFMRVALTPPPGREPAAVIEAFRPVAERFGMDWALHEQARRTRVLVMVSRFDHCLNDLLYRHSIGALPIEIPLIVSNHLDAYRLAAAYQIPFRHLPVTAQSKARQEAQLLELVEEERIDLVVLARYMQVLSDDLCRRLSGRAINIHHSFLPSFKGAKPYHQAFTRGVKLIGATAHYVTAALDEGPIIEQDVMRVDHSRTPEDLVALGRDVESVVLARAVKLHAEHRILLNGAKTVVFR
jgi:formyltetrahydrofolate deformylase